MMTPNDLSEQTGQNVGSIRRAIRQGKLPADRICNRYYICRDVVFKNAKEAIDNGTVIELAG